ncbi:insulinase family protein [Candidatus Shikimatogenerans silvanidophilus]|uniref:insulinase family protein n=1 Tax=Candidatus Shikimatogenerans silvanidophilus TaxID=2782547 RepID=UPI001BA9807D|nr:insulinase family protein [Candidatus Shikimatogenerans silvanidophilus]
MIRFLLIIMFSIFSIFYKKHFNYNNYNYNKHYKKNYIKKSYIKKYILPNVLKFILYNNKNNKNNKNTLVSVYMMYKYNVGIIHKKKGKNVFYNLFEHLLFNCNKNINKYNNKYNNNVLKINSYNKKNYKNKKYFTTYYELLPYNKLEIALILEYERMGNSKINNKYIENQKKFIIKEYFYSKQKFILNFIYKLLLFNKNNNKYNKYYVINYNNDIINDIIKKYFIDFYKKYYVPNNAVLSIYGNIDLKKNNYLLYGY